MDFFDYIADNDPEGVAAIIQSYGYQCQNVFGPQDLADCARFLVNDEGEDALRKLMSIHPDKEIIAQYSNFDGDSATIVKASCSTPKPLKASNDNSLMLVFMMGATLLITAAIITK